MPTACIFTLRPEIATTVTSGLGRAAHAAVLELIGTAEPAQAARIHADERIKPLTVALLDWPTGHGSRVAVTPARTYDLRVTLLAPALEALATGWTPAALPRLTLDGIAWRIERITSALDEHLWAGRTTFEALLAASLRDVARGQVDRWALEFVTPVTFRQGGRNQPLPLPDLVFGSLLDRWNALAPLPLPAEARQFAVEGMAVSRFDLRSAVVPTKGGAIQIGSVGRCAYSATLRDPYGPAWVEALARFAFYSGVGAGTARGFGQARLLSTRPAANVLAGRPTDAGRMTG